MGITIEKKGDRLVDELVDELVAENALLRARGIELDEIIKNLESLS